MKLVGEHGYIHEGYTKRVCMGFIVNRQTGNIFIVNRQKRIFFIVNRQQLFYRQSSNVKNIIIIKKSNYKNNIPARQNVQNNS